MNNEPNQWQKVADSKPENERMVETRVLDAQGKVVRPRVTETEMLRWIAGAWYFPNRKDQPNWTPTEWRIEA